MAHVSSIAYTIPRVQMMDDTMGNASELGIAS